MTHYEILGINKNATLDEIKKAYRALAMKYHPDRNYGDSLAADKFREITESYEVLIDIQKKAVYDDTAFFNKHPHEDLTDPNAFSASRRYKATSEELDEVVCHFFGGGGEVGRNVLVNLYLTSKELREGGMFTIKWKKRIKCDSCDGYGIQKEAIKCKVCSGTGLTKDMVIEEMMISIPVGIPSGHQIVVKGRGEQGEKGGFSGNLHVVVLG